jgi:hypothetical protein
MIAIGIIVPLSVYYYPKDIAVYGDHRLYIYASGTSLEINRGGISNTMYKVNRMFVHQNKVHLNKNRFGFETLYRYAYQQRDDGKYDITLTSPEQIWFYAEGIDTKSVELYRSRSRSLPPPERVSGPYNDATQEDEFELVIAAIVCHMRIAEVYNMIRYCYIFLGIVEILCLCAVFYLKTRELNEKIKALTGA